MVGGRNSSAHFQDTEWAWHRAHRTVLVRLRTVPGTRIKLRFLLEAWKIDQNPSPVGFYSRALGALSHSTDQKQCPWSQAKSQSPYHRMQPRTLAILACPGSVRSAPLDGWDAFKYDLHFLGKNQVFWNSHRNFKQKVHVKFAIISLIRKSTLILSTTVCRSCNFRSPTTTQIRKFSKPRFNSILSHSASWGFTLACEKFDEIFSQRRQKNG